MNMESMLLNVQSSTGSAYAGSFEKARLTTGSIISIIRPSRAPLRATKVGSDLTRLMLASVASFTTWLPSPFWWPLPSVSDRGPNLGPPTNPKVSQSPSWISGL